MQQPPASCDYHLGAFQTIAYRVSKPAVQKIQNTDWPPSPVKLGKMRERPLPPLAKGALYDKLQKVAPYEPENYHHVQRVRQPAYSYLKDAETCETMMGVPRRTPPVRRGRPHRMLPSTTSADLKEMFEEDSDTKVTKLVDNSTFTPSFVAFDGIQCAQNAQREGEMTELLERLRLRAEESRRERRMWAMWSVAEGQGEGGEDGNPVDVAADGTHPASPVERDSETEVGARLGIRCAQNPQREKEMTERLEKLNIRIEESKRLRRMWAMWSALEEPREGNEYWADEIAVGTNHSETIVEENAEKEPDKEEDDDEETRIAREFREYEIESASATSKPTTPMKPPTSGYDNGFEEDFESTLLPDQFQAQVDLGDNGEELHMPQTLPASAPTSCDAPQSDVFQDES